MSMIVEVMPICLAHERTAKVMLDFFGKGNSKSMEKLNTRYTQMIPVPRAVIAKILKGENLSMFPFVLVSLIFTRKMVRREQDDPNFNGLSNLTITFFTIETNLKPRPTLKKKEKEYIIELQTIAQFRIRAGIRK